MSKVSIFQLNQAELALAIQQYSSGAAFSGNFVSFVSSSGYMGPNVVATTGGSQTVLGQLTMANAITLPYAGGTGQSVARKYVDDQILSLSGATTGTSYAASVTYTNTVSGALQVLINAGGGGGSGPATMYTSGTQTVSGIKIYNVSPLVVTPSAPSGAANVLYVSGVSGALQALINVGGGGGAPNSVTTTGSATLSGAFYIFTGSPLVAAPVLPSGATNLLYVSGVSGYLYSQMTGISGVLASAGGGGLTNNFYITGTGTINNTINASGNVTNTFNSYQAGQGFNMSFFNDPVSTGFNLLEGFVSTTVSITGIAFACRTSGSGPLNGGILSGTIYQADFNNTEQVIYRFGFQSGIIYSGTAPVSASVTGGNRIGFSCQNSLSGIQKFTVGIFGL